MAQQLSTELIEALPPKLQTELETLLEDRFGVQSLRHYLDQYFPMQPIPRHANIVIDRIEQARHRRLWCLISMPPRHTKTTFALRGLGWWLRNDPADTCGYFSYSDKQARSKSRLARMWAEQAGVKLADDSKDMSEWRTTHGGGLLAGGAGGGLTGQGISGLMIVDDATKNREEADSLLMRDRVYEWFNEVVFTRLEGASVFVIGTRWHEDDLIGRLKREHPDKWEVINIPAIAEEDDVLGRAEGEPLWPDKYPRSELDAILAQIGEWSFASLYQGRPRPRGGQLFCEPTTYGRFPDLDGAHILMACDPAATAKTRADYSAIAVAAGKRDDRGLLRLDLLEMVRVQVEIPTLVAQIALLQRKWNCPVIIEAVGGFKAVPQMLRSIDRKVRIVELTPTGDKFTRALPVVAAWNDGRFRTPLEAPWLADFLDEVSSFTGVNDAHDDQIDTIAHLYNQFDAATRRPRAGRVISAKGLPFG